MSGLVDLTGQRFGHYRVIRRAQHPSKNIYWLCECDCGTQRPVDGSSLRDGRSRSCGCQARTTHGRAHDPLYGVWRAMKTRCLNSTDPEYPNYGGRGITVCDRWRDSFEAFITDMGERPADPEGWTSRNAYWSIDRIDNDGNYEPGNVRWASPEEQSNNQRPRRYEPVRHCPQGHPYDPDNTYVDPSGYRRCRTCRRAERRRRTVEQGRLTNG